MTTTLNTSAINEAQVRASELRDHWLSQPENYPPPPRISTRAQIDNHRNRWLASVEYAHAAMILSGAIDATDWPSRRAAEGI